MLCVALLGLFLLCGLTHSYLLHRWTLHVFNSLIFNVSQSIKVCFFFFYLQLIPAHHWPFSRALLFLRQILSLSHLPTLSVRQPDQLTLWVF